MVVSCCLAPGQHTTKRRKFAKYLPILKDFTDTQQRINLHPCRPIAPTNIREEHWVQCKDVCIRLQTPNFQPIDKRPKFFWTNGLWMLRIRKPAERAPMLNKVLLYLIVMCLQFFTILPGWPPDPLCAKFAIESRSAWHSTEYTLGWSDVTESMVTIYDRHFVGITRCVELNGEDLAYRSNKTESVSLRKCPYDNWLTNKSYLSAII